VMMTLEDSEEHSIGALAGGRGMPSWLRMIRLRVPAVLDLLFAKSNFSKESRYRTDEPGRPPARDDERI